MKNLLIILWTCIMTAVTLSAQESYEFSVETNSTYTDLTGSTSITNGQVWDDLDSIPIPIGFNFVLFGDTVSKVVLSEDAHIFTHINDVILNAFIPYGGVDLIDRGENTGTSLSDVSYKTEGEVGDRIFKVEWKNVGFFNDDASNYTSFMNFQLWLLEKNNEIEFHYGENSILAPIYDFEIGPLVAILRRENMQAEGEPTKFIFIAGNPSNPNIDTIMNTTTGVPPLLNGTPANGTVYKFSRQMTNTKDILENAHTLSIVPNPTSSVFNIELEDKDVKIEMVSIVNINGQEVLKTTKTQGIDVSKLNSGIYFVQINTHKGITTQRLVIE